MTTFPPAAASENPALTHAVSDAGGAQARTGCCGAAEQESCCGPAQKSECCGSAPSGSCGCR